jgi:hypothetical protein
MSGGPHDQAAGVPLDEQERRALEDYERVTLGREWSSVVPREPPCEECGAAITGGALECPKCGYIQQGGAPPATK